LAGGAVGGFTVNVSAEDSPAFAASSVTVIDAVVAKATRVCEIVAFMDVDVPPDSIVTPEVEPFQRIWGFVVEKLLPFAVSVKSADPDVMDVGLIELRDGVLPAEVLIEDHKFTRFVASIVPSPVA
jgi:hypothetical protein